MSARTSHCSGCANYLPLSGGTMTGDLDLAGHNLLTTNLCINELNASYLRVRNRANTADLGFQCSTLRSAYGMHAYWYPTTIRGYPSTTLGHIYLESYDGANQKVIDCINGRADIPRAGDIIPVGDNAQSLGDATHEFTVAYVNSIVGSVATFDDAMTALKIFLGVYSNATRGVAGIAGRVIYNSSDVGLNIDDGTNWRDTNGNIT